MKAQEIEAKTNEVKDLEKAMETLLYIQGVLTKKNVKTREHR